MAKMEKSIQKPKYLITVCFPVQLSFLSFAFSNSFQVNPFLFPFSPSQLYELSPILFLSPSVLLIFERK